MVARIVRAVGLGLAALLLAVTVQHVRNSGSSGAEAAAPGTLRVATLNVHYIMARAAEGPWSVGDWEARKGALDAAFKAVAADVFAFQEMETFSGGDNDDVNLTREFLLEQNPGYAAAAVGNWRDFPSTQPIFTPSTPHRLASTPVRLSVRPR